MALKSNYDVAILGAGHNGLVAAAYLARAGLSVLLLEKNDYIGGATTSKRIFPEYDARLSRYSYLVSLLPQKIIQDLGLRLELRRRTTASFTPYLRERLPQGLLLSNVSEGATRRSLLELTGHEMAYDQLDRFYQLGRIFAAEVWDSMLQPLRSRAELSRRFERDPLAGEAWRSLVEEPLGHAIENRIENDLLRGVVFTDAKIGLFTHPHDASLLQNRCFLYHIMGNRTGEWKVPVGGMGTVAEELIRVAASHGVQMRTKVQIKALDFSRLSRSVHFEEGEHAQSIDAEFVLLNFGENVLAGLMGQPYHPDATHEGSVLKVNMLLNRLPRLRASSYASHEAFTGTFHIDEGYEQMKLSYRQAAEGRLPDRIPSEIYCHTLTDDSILAPDLRSRGFHTLTLFALDLPWRLFADDHERMRIQATQRCLEGLNQWLIDPIEDCLAPSADGKLCLEAKSPVDLENELGHYHGNIFHRPLSFPFAESSDEVGTWGVETDWPKVFFCGSSARRGGAVSGIPGHNAAMKVLEELGAARS